MEVPLNCPGQLLTSFSEESLLRLQHLITNDFQNGAVMAAVSCALTSLFSEPRYKARLRHHLVLTNLSDNSAIIAMTASLQVRGRVFKDLCVLKLAPPERSHYLRVEEMIGMAMNRLRSELPNFIYTYGSFSCSPPAFGTTETTWCGQDSKSSYLMLETILPSTTFFHFQFTPETLLSAVLQISYSLRLAQRRFNFYHNDLHWNNVLMRVCDFPAIRYDTSTGMKTLRIFNYLATIIDFGEAYVVVDGTAITNYPQDELHSETYDLNQLFSDGSFLDPNLEVIRTQLLDFSEKTESIDVFIKSVEDYAEGQGLNLFDFRVEEVGLEDVQDLSELKELSEPQESVPTNFYDFLDAYERTDNQAVLIERFDVAAAVRQQEAIIAELQATPDVYLYSPKGTLPFIDQQANVSRMFDEIIHYYNLYVAVIEFNQIANQLNYLFDITSLIHLNRSALVLPAKKLTAIRAFLEPYAKWLGKLRSYNLINKIRDKAETDIYFMYYNLIQALVI